MVGTRTRSQTRDVDQEAGLEGDPAANPFADDLSSIACDLRNQMADAASRQERSLSRQEQSFIRQEQLIVRQEQSIETMNDLCRSIKELITHQISNTAKPSSFVDLGASPNIDRVPSKADLYVAPPRKKNGKEAESSNT